MSLPLAQADAASAQVGPLCLDFGKSLGVETLGLGGVSGVEASLFLALADERTQIVGTRLRSQKMPVLGCFQGRAIARGIVYHLCVPLKQHETVAE
jgi:hypothetical protein